MKKLCLLLIAMVTLALLIGCATPAPAPAAAAPAPAAQEAAPVSPFPSWFLEIPPADEIWGVGLAKLTDPNLALQVSTTRAQTDVARQLSTVVQAMLTDYSNDSGIAGNSRAMQSIESIQRNVTNMTLTGATPNKRDAAADGTIYVRVAIKKADAQKQAFDIIDNELANYAEYRRENALAALDSQISSTNFKPQGVTE